MTGAWEGGLRPGRPAGTMLAIRKAGGIGQLARLCGVSKPSVSKWDTVPRERVPVIAAALGLKPEQIRPDLADFYEAERERGWIERARARFAIASGLPEGATATVKAMPGRPEPGTMDLLDLGLIVAAMRFAAEEAGLHVRAVMGAPAGGAGGTPTPEQSARSRGMALAVVVGRVNSETVAGVAGVSRQAVDNATERYLRQRDGDDPETVENGQVIERGRRRAAKGPDEQVWADERRFVRRLAGEEG